MRPAGRGASAESHESATRLGPDFRTPASPRVLGLPSGSPQDVRGGNAWALRGPRPPIGARCPASSSWWLGSGTKLGWDFGPRGRSGRSRRPSSARFCSRGHRLLQPRAPSSTAAARSSSLMSCPRWRPDPPPISPGPFSRCPSSRQPHPPGTQHTASSRVRSHTRSGAREMKTLEQPRIQ